MSVSSYSSEDVIKRRHPGWRLCWKSATGLCFMNLNDGPFYFLKAVLLCLFHFVLLSLSLIPLLTNQMRLWKLSCFFFFKLKFGSYCSLLDRLPHVMLPVLPWVNKAPNPWLKWSFTKLHTRKMYCFDLLHFFVSFFHSFGFFFFFLV
jgi:hypothetical protein